MGLFLVQFRFVQPLRCCFDKDYVDTTMMLFVPRLVWVMFWCKLDALCVAVWLPWVYVSTAFGSDILPQYLVGATSSLVRGWGLCCGMK